MHRSVHVSYDHMFLYLWEWKHIVTNLKQHSWGARFGLHPHISYFVHEFTHTSIVRIFIVVISYALVLFWRKSYSLILPHGLGHGTTLRKQGMVLNKMGAESNTFFWRFKKWFFSLSSLQYTFPSTRKWTLPPPQGLKKWTHIKPC